jgi:Ni/Co efflux regulator RcnB
MKKLLISAFAMSLAIALPTALSAEQHHDQGASHGASHGSTGGRGSSGGGTGGHHTTMVSHHTTMGTTHHSYRHTSLHTTTHHTTVINRTTVRRTNVDVSSYRKAFNAPNHYHYGDYHGPAGYSYHRWNYGDNLPREYWAQNYWIGNFLNFGLIAPPDGYVWVRYGPDAVLIDEDTGEIIQVEYGIFY